MVRKRALVFMGLLVAHGGAMAQAPAGDRPIYPEKLHQDMEVLRTTLHQAHPDPYRFVSAAGLDRAFAQVQDAVAVPMAPSAFRDALLPLFHALGDPRCTPLPPPRSEARADAPMIPLQVRIVDGAIHVEQEPKGFRSLPPGARIISINGHSATDILQRLNAQVVAEGANTTLRHAIIGRDFPQLFHRHVDPAPAFTVRYINALGTEEELRVAGLTLAEMSISRQTQRQPPPPWTHELVLDDRAAWLRLRTLDKDTLAAAGIRPDRYLDALLKELRANKAEVLVVDVRGAGGRDLAMAETVFAAFAEMPFRAVKDMTTRCLAPPVHYAHVRPVPDHFTMVRDRFKVNGDGTASLKDVPPGPPLAPPVKAPFTGKVYVVCDGSTRDAGAALVMLAKRQGRARVIGEEVGTNAASFTGGRDLLLTLPNSGVTVAIPLVRYIPDGECTGPDHGEKPHFTLAAQPGDAALGRDTVRDRVLRLLNEL